MPEDGRPQAKDGGFFAGIATLIREIGELAQSAGGIIVVLIGVGAVATIASASLGTVPDGRLAAELAPGTANRMLNEAQAAYDAETKPTEAM